MCGFAGFIDFKRTMGRKKMQDLVQEMNELIHYRGPDDHGEWVDEECGIALGHRRLSIIDLSEDGHQPMVSASGRYILSYNGEVYNFGNLRKNLIKQGYHFKGHSDTEVLVACFEEWGVDEAIKKFNGMFSFAVWDRKELKLFLVRDRIGIKPLYYAVTSSNVVFGSELKPLMESGKIEKRIDIESLSQYFKYLYIPAPRTIFKNVFKLNPGSIFEFDLETKNYSVKKYWDAKKIIGNSAKSSFNGSEEEALLALEGIVDKAVGCRMVADVPFGAFLSGGIDSSLVVATMQKLSTKPVKSFTIGFEDAEFNEAIYAKDVADHLGTDHTDMYITETEARDVIPDLPTMWDEPFADYSQIPTYLVSKLTREHVTVSLSGDGGDELFGGYGRYYSTNSVWNMAQRIPYPLRKGLSSLLGLTPHFLLEGSYKLVKPLLNDSLKFDKISPRVDELNQVLNKRDVSEVYERARTYWLNHSALVGESKSKFKPEKSLNDIPAPNLFEKMMGLDILTYLPDDILTKVDRASMTTSLEARVPLLDHRVAEFAWQLPSHYKYKNSPKGSKWILRKLLYKYVSKELIDRPKMGFSVPLSKWLRGPLKDWTTDLLSEHELDKHGLLDQKIIQEVLETHLKGKANMETHLWSVLMFQSWYNKWMDA